MGVFSTFVEDMRNWFSGSSVLGVDIGTVSMKLVELSRGKGSVNLTGYGMLETREYLERGNAVIQTSSLKISERDAVLLLKTLVAEAKPKTKRVVASIPAFCAFFAPLEMPALSPLETAKSVAFQARQYIPLPPDQVSIDWSVISTGENDRGQAYQRVLLTGIPKTTVATYQRIFKAAGLKLTALEVETQALARSLPFESSEGATLVVDLGGVTTEVIIISKGAVSEVGQTDYGGVTLTQALARSLTISPRRAEDLKRRRGLSSQPGEYELSTSLYPFVDVILQECKRIRSAYERRGGPKVEQFSIVGGGGSLQGIERYVSKQLNLPHVAPTAIGSRIKASGELDPILGELNRELATAVGLALRIFP